MQHLLARETNNYSTNPEARSSTEPQYSLPHSQQPNTVLHSEPNKKKLYLRSILISPSLRPLYQLCRLLPMVA
jgi:hypothetical protein